MQIDMNAFAEDIVPAGASTSTSSTHAQVNPNERHEYAANILWTGSRQGTTSSYQAYSREYEFHVGSKAVIRGSADPHFRGDPSLYNPEELLVVALSTCHLLTYLADCARAGIHVLSY